MSLAAAICSVPWLCTVECLETILAVAERELSLRVAPELVEARKAQRQKGSKLRTRDGVGIIDVRGPIVRHADLFTELCDGTSTASLATTFTEALDRHDVHSVLLAVDSPGGEAAGIGDLAQLIANARGKGKPIVAHVDGAGASAAYWIASAAEEVALSRTAFVGSIGAVFTYRDNRAAMERQGVRQVEFVSSVSPEKRPDVATDLGRAVIQRQADALGLEFARSVARQRGITLEDVKAARGGMLMGREAVRARLADRVSTFEAEVQRLTARKTR